MPLNIDRMRPGSPECEAEINISVWSGRPRETQLAKENSKYDDDEGSTTRLNDIVYMQQAVCKQQQLYTGCCKCFRLQLSALQALP